MLDSPHVYAHALQTGSHQLESSGRLPWKRECVSAAAQPWAHHCCLFGQWVVHIHAELTRWSFFRFFGHLAVWFRDTETVDDLLHACRVPRSSVVFYGVRLYRTHLFGDQLGRATGRKW